jgi:benzylsuccinate CoA-transferase BbsF subunit
VEATACALEPAYLDYFANGHDAAPQGNRDPNHAPQGCYPCRGEDAWCVISCSTDAEWDALARVIGGEGLARDARFATAAARRAKHDSLDALIAAWTRERTPYQAMRVLQAAGVPAGAVQTGEDLWRDHHLRDRGTIVEVDHPDIGRVEHPGMTVRLSGTPGQIRRPSGLLGEENDAVFRGLCGLSTADITRLAGEGILA